jgi:hypothetical protein
MLPDAVVPRQIHRPAPPADALSLADHLTQPARPGGTAFLLDLQPSLAVQVAAELNGRGLAHVVLVLQRWPHAEAVLPVDDLITTLVRASRRLLAAPASANVAFVLDAERSQPIHRRAASDRRIDNRYQVGPGELPDLGTLRRAGIQRVVKLARRT